MPENKIPQTDSEENIPAPEPKEFPIVCIGASAGGLDALEKFFSHIPRETDMAFAVIQHLSPDHKSLMSSLLEKHTSMKISVMEDGMEAQSRCVYLNPPDQYVSLFHGVFHLRKADRKTGWLPIDFFFRSVAEDQGKKAIAVVLSGTASDGTQGIKTVKEKDGMVMVQKPETAAYDGMPRSAIATGLADYILPVEDMAAELLRYVKHPYVKSPADIQTSEHTFSGNIQKILAHIRTVTGNDFSCYKINTIRRRVERRMAVHQIDSLSDYTRYLHENPLEARILFKDMLIGVTDFFRDPEAFAVLENRVLPDMFRKLPDHSNLRIWVTACSSGEEAYSIAMLTAEVMEKTGKKFNIQIFASDIDANAVDLARKSVYPESISASVSPERMRRFFIREGLTCRVKKQIREMLVFAVHNLIQAPPFSKIDLLCCRNLLIYLDSSAQKKIFPMLHYTLNPGGILFLGTSESIGEFTDFFEPEDKKWKIYRKRDFSLSSCTYSGSPVSTGLLIPDKRTEKKMLTPADAQRMAERFILDHYAPAGAVIDEEYQIHHFIGKTDPYLKTPTGRPSFNILEMAREGLKHKLRAAIQKSVLEKKICRCESVRVKYNGGFRMVDLMIVPLGNPGSPGFRLLLFDEKKPPLILPKTETAKDGETAETDPVIANLEYELQSTRESLQTFIEELETSNEELRSGNEELQSVNEELQSANEEMETSKEELQSANEELATVNAELQKKVDELSGVKNDISNLLAGTEIGTIFLDNDLCIKRFTPAVTRIFNLIGTDIGRPLRHITACIAYENLHRDILGVIQTLNRQEKEIQSLEGKWYHLRISPYRTVDNVIDGVVITFSDITMLKRKDQALQESIDRLRLSLKLPGFGTSAWDIAKDIIVWEGENHPLFDKLTGTRSGKYQDFLHILHPEDREYIRSAVFLALEKDMEYSLKYRVILPDGSTRQVLEKGMIYRDPQGKAIRTSGFCRDISG